MSLNLRNGETEASLSSLRPCSLDDITSLSLMNRIEKKYILSASKIPSLINLLAERCQILQIGNIRIFPYFSTYFDTADFLFYNQHIRGKSDRYKIRYRKYESTGLSFLEIKKKTNKGRTIKWRIEKKLSDFFSENGSAEFIGEHSPVVAADIGPVLINRFNRITFASFESRERITIDMNLTFSAVDRNGDISFPNLAIVEIKRESYSDSLYLRDIFKQISSYPTSFSKYCIGSSLTNDSLKKNILKPKLLLIKKLENEYT